MAFSIPSPFAGFSTIKHITTGQPNRSRWYRTLCVGAPRSSVIITRMSLESSNSERRRSANYPPSMWDDGYIQSLTVDATETDAAVHARMLETVRRDLVSEGKSVVDRLQLVDTLQQLGVAYHFEPEIKDVLTAIHRSLDTTITATKDDLYAVSLLFRLLREHELHVSSDVFNNFKEENGGFKASFRNDVKGILSLYEASFLSMDGENQMEEAKHFATTSLRDLITTGFGFDVLMKEKVSYALDLPLHWRTERLHTRWFIKQYENDEDLNPTLLKFAKLDFNVVQSIHKKEVKKLSRWWRDLGLSERLPFARDRLVENYLWTVGWAFEPKFGRTREAMAKANCFITIIDDVYDIYGTMQELELFTDAVERWDASAILQLPDYMKICFMALYNTTNDTAYKTLKLKGVDVLPLLRRVVRRFGNLYWEDICKAYLVEAKWYHQGYKPTLNEYLDNGCISILGHIAITQAYCASENLTREAVERFNFYPEVVYDLSMILRLYDDLGTSTAELERGDVPKSIQCYMHENKVLEATARDSINKMIASTWKKLNRDRFASSSFEESFKKVALNIPRMAQCMYKNGDGHGNPDQEIKDHIISLLIRPIPL